MDLFDRAQEAEERDRKQALTVALRSGRRIGPSALVCIDCGGNIPETRRLAMVGCVRCVGCEQEYETERRT